MVLFLLVDSPRKQILDMGIYRFNGIRSIGSPDGLNGTGRFRNPDSLIPTI